ncbi:putative LPS assembly protein LptD [Candidatus Zixiibacteriota bacterium]
MLVWACAADGLESPLLLKHADHGESHWRDDRLVTILKGDVQFAHDTMQLSSDRATWHQDEGLVVFEGNVTLEDTAQSLRAQRLTYLQGERKALADGQVILTDSSNHVVLTAGHVDFERDAKIARAALDPRLVISREDGSEPVVIRGRHMEVFSRRKEAAVADQVTISRGDLIASCGRARYLDAEGRILLENSPIVRKDKSTLRGEEMVLQLEDNEVSRIDVRGEAFGEYMQAPDSVDQNTGRHQMTARQISFFLSQERIDRILAEGNATTIYLPSEEGTEGQGENRTSGDRLEIFLVDEKVEHALVEGGALGYYVSAERQREEADTAKYGAERIDFSLADKEISLQEEAFVDYGEISLKAHSVVYNTKTEVLTAQQDTSGNMGDPGDQGRPVLREGTRELTGSYMVYSLKTQRGKVIGGETEFEKGFYRGSSIRKVDEQVLKASHGTFTTCDEPERPHYHFYSRRMKIILKDKVIAKPMVLYIGRIPMMILPFWVFPTRPGRHSGLLIPRYGSTDTDGRYLRGLGYYLAPSQYWDATVSLDLYERTGWLLDFGGRYAVRYLLNGSVAGSYKWDERYSGSVLQKRRRWDLRLSHYQDISPTLQVRANGTFIGQKDESYYQDISYDPYQRMDRNLHSYLSVDKTWPWARANMALDQRWDLDQDVTTRYLPTFSFQRSEAPIYRRRSEGKSKQPQEQPWYSSIYYRYSARFINSQKDWTAQEDGQSVDKHEEHQALDQTLGLRVPITLLRHLVLTPSATYRETWFDRDKSGEKYVRRGDYDASMGATTTLYGLIQPQLGPLTGIRHVITPSLNFSWRPEFENRDDYHSVPFIHSVGGPQKTLGISLANQVQIRLKQGEKERKLNLANLNFSTSYNFRAEPRRLANLNSSLRVNPSSRFNITLSARHDFYQADGDKLKLLSPRLLSFSVDTRVSLKGAGIGRHDDSSGEGRGWRLSLSHRYSESRGSLGTRKTSWLNGTVSFSPTKNWRVDYSGRYDLEDHKSVSQRVEFYRDLHCWEARFVWEPTGIRQGYYVRVNIKAIPEIKLERVKGIRR